MVSRVNTEKLEAHLFALGGIQHGSEIVFPCVSGNHEDRHPSAGYNLEKQVWHCFACGAGGGWKDLAQRLGLLSEYSSCVPTPPRQYMPHFRLDWKFYSN